MNGLVLIWPLLSRPMQRRHLYWPSNRRYENPPFLAGQFLDVFGLKVKRQRAIGSHAEIDTQVCGIGTNVPGFGNNLVIFLTKLCCWTSSVWKSINELLWSIYSKMVQNFGLVTVDGEARRIGLCPINRLINQPHPLSPIPKCAISLAARCFRSPLLLISRQRRKKLFGGSHSASCQPNECCCCFTDGFWILVWEVGLMNAKSTNSNR